MKDKQCDRLLAALRHGPVDPMKSWRELGIYRLSARVFDLRQSNHEIEKCSKEVVNQFGEKCRVAEYRLIREASCGGSSLACSPAGQ